VFAKVIAKNVMGTSSISAPGNGAILKLSVPPDAPVSLARDDLNTFAGQITLNWQDGAFDGGQPVDYYRVSHD
jgi:hypothetical protein